MCLPFDDFFGRFPLKSQAIRFADEGCKRWRIVVRCTPNRKTVAVHRLVTGKSSNQKRVRLIRFEEADEVHGRAAASSLVPVITWPYPQNRVTDVGSVLELRLLPLKANRFGCQDHNTNVTRAAWSYSILLTKTFY